MISFLVNKKSLAILHLLILCIITNYSFSLTVDEAYKLIPHRRTSFDHNLASMPVEDKLYLKNIFELTDLATVERVNKLMWLTSGRTQGENADNYDYIISRLYSINPPQYLFTFHNLIIQAIEEQRFALASWMKSPFNIDQISAEPYVISSSNKLKKAYKILMNSYPQETAHIKESFFDHLCALDFI